MLRPCLLYILCAWSPAEIQKTQLILPNFYPRILKYWGIFIPLFTEFFFNEFGVVKVYCTINFLKIGTYCFPVLIRHKFTGISYLMDNTKLIFCPRENWFYCLIQTCQIIMASYENVRNTAVFQVCAYARIEAWSTSLNWIIPESRAVAISG